MTWQSLAKNIFFGSVLSILGYDTEYSLGGYKHSANCREFGEHSFSEYLEAKSPLGYSPAMQ